MDCEVCRGSPLPGMVITPSGPVHCPNHCIGASLHAVMLRDRWPSAHGLVPWGNPSFARMRRRRATSLPPVISLDLAAGFCPIPGRHFCDEP